METILELNNLTKYFGQRKIVNGISLKINSGEIVGFLGPNGSGKTTTIKMLAGLLFPDCGSISICGHDVATDFEAAIANFGGIVENPDMYKELSGRTNLELAARIHGNVSCERIDEVIRIVGLENRIDDKVKKYSLGMKQRLGIALAILHKPRCLVFDEPTNGLDPKGIKDFRDIIKHLAHEEGAAVFVSSHMMSEMQLTCDKVAIIENGTLLGIQDVRAVVEGVRSELHKLVVSEKDRAIGIINEGFGDIVRNAETSVIANGTASAITVAMGSEDIPLLNKKLVLNDISVYSIQALESTLEDAYINITGGKIH